MPPLAPNGLAETRLRKCTERGRSQLGPVANEFVGIVGSRCGRTQFVLSLGVNQQHFGVTDLRYVQVILTGTGYTLYPVRDKVEVFKHIRGTQVKPCSVTVGKIRGVEPAILIFSP